MRKLVLFLVVFFMLPAKNSFAFSAKINEIIANPSEGDKEWVELYSTDISDFSTYYLEDKAGTKKTLENLQNCSSYFVWELTSSSGEGWLNNAGDESISLYDQNDNIIDTTGDWTSASEGKSLSRVPDISGDLQETDPTKCAQNQAPTPSPTPTPSPSPSPSSTPTTSSSATTAKKSPSPSPKISPKVSPSPSPSPSPQVLAEQKDITDGFNDLANSGALISPSPEALTYYGSFTKNFSLILAGAGAIFVGLSFIFYLWYKKSLEAKAQIIKGNDRFDGDKDPQV